MTILGTDTSNHDIIDRNGGNNLDWAAIRRDGVQFGWHKVSDGLNFYEDPTAAMALAGMRANLDIWGGYHVLWGSRSITGQLDWFASILDRIAAGWRTDPRFVAVWDCEPFGYNTAPSINQVNEAGDYWLNHVVGRKSGGYCPPWHYGGALNGLRYPLISSDYGVNGGGRPFRLYPGDNSDRWQATPQRQADVLQFGSNIWQGPHRNCDGDAYRGDIDQLVRLFAGKVPDVTQPLQPALTPDEHRRLVSLEEREHQKNMGDPEELTYPLPADQVGGPNDRGNGMGATPNRDKVRHTEVMDALKALGQSIAGIQVAGQPDQAQVDAAILKAMLDPAVQKGIGDAIASHLRVVS